MTMTASSRFAMPWMLRSVAVPRARSARFWPIRPKNGIFACPLRRGLRGRQAVATAALRLLAAGSRPPTTGKNSPRGRGDEGMSTFHAHQPPRSSLPGEETIEPSIILGSRVALAEQPRQYIDVAKLLEDRFELFFASGIDSPLGIDECDQVAHLAWADRNTPHALIVRQQ